jgi:hypothetical protein
VKTEGAGAVLTGKLEITKTSQRTLFYGYIKNTNRNGVS